MSSRRSKLLRSNATTIVIILLVVVFASVLAPKKEQFIVINSDADFQAFASSGNGTMENPFIIEDRIIANEATKAISISNTTNFFVIRNCYIADNIGYGIYLEDVANGTALIEYNLVINHEIGITLKNCNFVEIINNTFIENYNAIDLFESVNNTISYNSFSENTNGIIISDYSSKNTVLYNLFENSTSWSISILDFSNNNTIHHNNFLNNNLGGISQASDNSSFNVWYDLITFEGNHWNDLLNSNYTIAGSANSVDLYPLNDPVQLAISRSYS